MSAESWQNTCPRCGWANSGAERRCMKCGQPLRTSPGLLVAGQSASSAISPSSQAKPRRVVQPGGFFPRLIAIIIDTLILGVVTVPIVYLVLAQHVTPTGQSNAFLDQLKGLGGSSSQYTPEQLTQLVQLFAGIAILMLFYYVGTWSILGGSPGQLVMSLRIVDGSARTTGFGRALLRYIMKGFFGFLWPVSVLMVAFGKDKRAIHDFLAGTYVIQFLDPKLEDFDSVLPPAQAAPLPPGATPPPVTSPVPQEIYAGAALPAAAVSGPAPAAPEPTAASAAPEPPAPASPPPPAAPPSTGGGAPIPSAAPMAPPPAPPMVPAAPDQSGFGRYSSPGEPTPAPAPDPPVFPISDPGGYQPMAPAPAAPAPTAPVPAPPSAPGDPGSGAPGYQPPTQPYALPFSPQKPPPDGSPPDATPPADPPTP